MTFDQAIIDPQQQSLALKLSHLPCFNFKVDNISVINTGLSQPCFQVNYDNKTYFAKYLIANSIEPLASQLAARAGISPKLIYVGQNWLITEFIAGQGLDNGHQSEEEKLVVTIALLARCHNIALSSTSSKSESSDSNHQNLAQKISLTDDQLSKQSYLPSLDISATIEQLLQNIALSSTQHQALKFLVNVFQQNLAETHKIVQHTRQVFCHGDANYSNIIALKNETKNPENLYKIIDFECACIGPIAYDLAMLMAVNSIDSSKVEMITSRYQQALTRLNQQQKLTKIIDNLTENTHENSNISPLLVTCYFDFSLLINGLWYLSQYQGRKLIKYKILSIKQLMLLAIRHPQVNRLLDEMR
ncbi:phosphotransferase [Colwellia sp. MB02u-10]|uniref:phosphotransferase n=1 Tax=Colwellia sp. MB02u-10 TaxID=2759828 RepID=UPI0015F408E6|nr:phosphotransferase [Colwellia sp. MB02u-10]MBA6342636.1 phosphotransferase [Colwellia sp. MB02u-10]